MNTFYVVTNTQKDPEYKNADVIRKYLENKGKKCYVQKEEENTAKTYKYTNADKIPPDTECVLVLGGDGTLLQAARDLVRWKLPFFGINFGTLGYLSEREFSDYPQALDKLCLGEFTVENRMMIEGDAYKGGRKVLSDLALNDVVIIRRGHLKIIDFDVYVDDSFLCSYRADGIIVATPTGSTGYSLSAGGPIVDPGASLMILTPVAPHTLTSRPVILPDNVTITIRLSGRMERQGADCAEAVFDGDTSLICGAGDYIKIRRSECSTQMVKTNRRSFVETLRSKMN